MLLVQLCHCLYELHARRVVLSVQIPSEGVRLQMPTPQTVPHRQEELGGRFRGQAAGTQGIEQMESIVHNIYKGYTYNNLMSQQAVSTIISSLLSKTHKQVSLHTLQNNCLNPLCLKKINYVLDSIIHQPSIPLFPKLHPSQQPKPIQLDSMTPTATHLLPPSSPSLRTHTQPISLPNKNKNNKPLPPVQYTTLIPLPSSQKQEQQDTIVKEVRRVQHQSQLQQQFERRKKEVRQEKPKPSKFQKEDRFIFDYAGAAVVTTSGLQLKTNLVVRSTKEEVNPQTTVNKAAGAGSVENVDNSKRENKKGVNRSKGIEGIAFSGVNSLIEGVEVQQGVKYSYQAVNLQTKKVGLSAEEWRETLKLSRSSRRLSKEEYSRLDKVVLLHYGVVKNGKQQGKVEEQSREKSRRESKVQNSTNNSNTIVVSNQEVWDDVFPKEELVRHSSVMSLKLEGSKPIIVQRYNQKCKIREKLPKIVQKRNNMKITRRSVGDLKLLSKMKQLIK